MSGTDTADAPTKTVEELQEELQAEVKKYERLTTAHEKLKADLQNLKAAQADVASIQAQLEKAIGEKSKLLREKADLEKSLEDVKKEGQLKDARSALSTALDAAGVERKALQTALKLANLTDLKFENGEVSTDSLTTVVEALKESDPILFTEGEKTSPSSPPVRHAVEKVTQSAYETEIAAAVKKGDQKELEAVYAKYHRA